MSQKNPSYRGRMIKSALLEEIGKRIESDAVKQAETYRAQLQKTVAILYQTRNSFRSKQLKNLREEIEETLKKDQP